MGFITHLSGLRAAVTTYANLPLTGNVQGDLRVSTDTGDAYTWMLEASSGSLTDWNKVTTASYADLIGAPYSTALDIDNAVKVVTGLSINIALLAFNTLTGYWSSLAKMFDGVINQFTAEDSGLEVEDCENQTYVNIQENVYGGFYLPNKGDLDIYTRMLIHGDGIQGSTSFVDLLKQPLVSSNAIVDLTTKKFGTGSIKFNGTNSYLAISDASGVIMGKYIKGEFYAEPMCLDFWFYSLASGLQPILANIAYDDGYGKTYDAGEYLSIQRKANGKIYANVIVTTDMGMTDTLIEVESSSSVSDNAWHHIAIQKVDGYLQIWIDGSLDATSVEHVESENSACQALIKFGQLDATFLNGHLDEIRLSNTERYTTTFTPMTKAYNTATTPAPTPVIEDISSGAKTVTVLGNARMSGTNPLFGNASLYLDGINSYLSLADSDDWKLSTGVSGGIDSAVKLLLHLDNDVVDSELTPKTITNNGVTFSSSVKKFGSHAASFNGSSAYLSIPASSDFNFGTADFTIDFWCTVADVDARSPIFHTNDSSATSYIGFYARWLIPDNPLKPLVSIPGLGSSMRGFDMSLNTWTHLALVRYNNVLYLYQNGVLAESRSYSAAINLGSFTQLIGTTPWGGFHTGGLDELRISKGIARWTSEFTPPIAPYGGYGSNFLTGGTASSDSYYASPYTADKAVDGSTSTMWVSDLNPFPHWWKYDLGSGISKTVNKVRIYNFSDSNGNHLKDFTVQGSNDDSNWTVVYTGQGANIPADWQEFTFSNTTAYRYYKIVENNTWRSDNAGRLMEIEMMEEIPTLIDYTVDLWIDPLSLNDANTFIIGQEDSWKLTLDGTSNKYLKYTIVGGVSVIAPIALSLETWSHIAIVQKDGIIKLYVNGILGASVAGSAMVNGTSVLSIGADSTGAHMFNGFIEEVRVSNNARWAAAFTPPSVEYSSDSNTKLLLPLNVQTVPNMVLHSVGYVANYVPTSARVVIFEEDIDVMEPNVDLVIEISRDGGTTFTTCLIAKDQEFGDGTLNLFSGSLDLRGQPNGELLVWKLTTQNNKDCRIRGVSLSWR